MNWLKLIANITGSLIVSAGAASTATGQPVFSKGVLTTAVIGLLGNLAGLFQKHPQK